MLPVQSLAHQISALQPGVQQAVQVKHTCHCAHNGTLLRPDHNPGALWLGLQDYGDLCGLSATLLTLIGFGGIY